jgi:hypothetical protein
MYGHSLSLSLSLSLSIFWSPKYYNTLNKRERGEMWRHVWMCLRVFCPSGNWIEEEVLLLLFGTQFMPLVARPSIRLSRYMFCKVFSLFLHIPITQTHTQKHTHTHTHTHKHTHTHTHTHTHKHTHTHIQTHTYFQIYFPIWQERVRLRNENCRICEWQSKQKWGPHTLNMHD